MFTIYVHAHMHHTIHVHTCIMCMHIYIYIHILQTFTYSSMYHVLGTVDDVEGITYCVQAYVRGQIHRTH